MQTSLSRRVQALEEGAIEYKSIYDVPDEVLLALIAPLCGGRTPTDEDLLHISLKISKEAHGANT